MSMNEYVGQLEQFAIGETLNLNTATAILLNLF
jgi:hypothetical protein